MTEVSLGELLLRLVVSLAVVIGLMLVAAWVVRRKGGAALLGGGGRSPFTVVARQSLTKSASLQVVTIGDRALVLGVTEQSVTLLAEADPELFPEGRSGSGEVSVEVRRYDGGSGAQRTALPEGDASMSPGPAWKAGLEQLRERSVRR